LIEYKILPGTNITLIYFLVPKKCFIGKSTKNVSAKRFQFFFVRHSELENFLLCERILINVNLSKRNVKLILKILSDLEPLRGSSNKKMLYSTRSCAKKPQFTRTRQINHYLFHARVKNSVIIVC
jgi:hypothetical protein